MNPVGNTRRSSPASTFPRFRVMGIFLAWCFPLAAVAQPEVPVINLLFEPAPIPEPGEESVTLVTFNDLAGMPVPVERQGLGSDERRAIETDIEEYVAAIGDKESEEGPYTSQLKEDLFAAGLLAQELEDHDRAEDFFKRAQSVSRINNGLDTLEQVPLMEALVQSYHASGQLDKADETQAAILDLLKRVHGNNSVELIPKMHDLGVWHMDAFLERSNILVNIDRMNVTRFMQDPANYIHQHDPRETPLFNLYQAQRTLLNAVSILVENEDYFNPLLLDLERMLLKNYFLSMHRENILYEPDFYLTRKKRKTGSRLNTNAIELMNAEEYQLGLTSHQRSVAYVSNNPERTPAQLATVMLEAADWHLLFERKVKAAGQYQDIHDYFAQNPELEAAAAAVLYPQYPQILPVYLPPPNSREKLDIAPDEQVNFFGWFDVSYRIDEYGKARRIRVLDKGGEVTRNMEIRLNQYLQNVLFRPRFKDAEPDTDTIRLRYYVGV